MHQNQVDISFHLPLSSERLEFLLNSDSLSSLPAPFDTADMQVNGNSNTTCLLILFKKEKRVCDPALQRTVQRFDLMAWLSHMPATELMHVSPQRTRMCETLIPTVTVFGGGAFGGDEVMSGPLMNGVSALTETPWRAPSTSAV